MRTGTWHQFGDRSQTLALEQLKKGVGVGVILSPRDLNYDNAVSRASEYRDLGAHVLLDQQFYVPNFLNEKIDSYPTSPYRVAASKLHQLSENQLNKLS